MQDEKLVKEIQKIMDREICENFNITQDGVLMMKGRVCVLDVEDLRKLIMKEAHCSAYAMHPSSTKIYQTIKENYWWSSMKKKHCKLRIKVFSVPTGKGRTSETS